MRGIKRGKLILLVIHIFIILICAGIGLAGWCLDTLSDYYCLDVTETECCGGTCLPANFNTNPNPPDVCELGCCCFFEYHVISAINPLATCRGLTDYEFIPTISDPAECSNYCTGSYTPPNGSGNPECNNGDDDDDDGLTDYPNDPGCASLTDRSETDTNVQCLDGIDNDGDGDVDDSDSCCISHPTMEENFCSLVSCTTTGQISSGVSACNCYLWRGSVNFNSLSFYNFQIMSSVFRIKIYIMETMHSTKLNICNIIF